LPIDFLADGPPRKRHTSLPVAASTASQHLKILKEAGFITGTIDGPHRCYCIDKSAYHELKDWIEKL